MAGVETTYSSPSMFGFAPQETSSAVERLIEAGAVVFAKTTVSKFAYFGMGEASLFGRTSNPWDLERNRESAASPSREIGGHNKQRSKSVSLSASHETRHRAESHRCCTRLVSPLGLESRTR